MMIVKQNTKELGLDNMEWHNLYGSPVSADEKKHRKSAHIIGYTKGKECSLARKIRSS